jgi:hypothetical protein
LGFAFWHSLNAKLQLATTVSYPAVAVDTKPAVAVASNYKVCTSALFLE